MITHIRLLLTASAALALATLGGLHSPAGADSALPEAGASAPSEAFPHCAQQPESTDAPAGPM